MERQVFTRPERLSASVSQGNFGKGKARPLPCLLPLASVLFYFASCTLLPSPSMNAIDQDSDDDNGIPCQACTPDAPPSSTWFHNWTTCDDAQVVFDDGLRGVCMAKGRLLYKGVDRECQEDGIPTSCLQTQATFAASLPTACVYSFDARAGKMTPATHSKVVTLQTMRPLCLVNMWNAQNHARMIDAYPHARQMIETSFPRDGEQWKRTIHRDHDIEFLRWFGAAYPMLDGWYVLPDDDSWHDEVCIYKTDTTLYRTRIEVRCRYVDLRFLELCIDGVSHERLVFRDRCPHKRNRQHVALHQAGRFVFQGMRHSGKPDLHGLAPDFFRPSEAFLWNHDQTELLSRESLRL
jgi:hypothetical protein